MSALRVMEWRTLDEQSRRQLLGRGRECFDERLRAEVEGLVEDVRANGDEALLRALREFDQCRIGAEQIAVGPEEIERAREAIPPALREALLASIERVRAFNQRSLRGHAWTAEIEPGIEVGQRLAPIASAGLFVPSGKGSFPSTLYQVATAAVVAGVPEIAVVVPPVPGSDGEIDQAVLFVASELGIDRVYRANGPSGIAALAFGTETVPKAVKVLGPGSSPVQAAQVAIQRYGATSVMLFGPTESMVIADGSADPRLLAADLLTEAEHGLDSASVLVTAERGLLETTERELELQLAALPELRRTYARSALGEVGGAVLVADLEQAVAVANLYAPEHLQLAVSRPEDLVPELDHAAELLLGQATTFAAANYTIGVPAVLPTSRYARVASGVTASAFTKAISIAKVLPAGAESVAEPTIALADWEGFPAHAAALRERRRDGS